MEDDQASHYCVLWNSGIFSNRPKGKLYVEGRLNLYSGSTLNNQGHMFSTTTIPHVRLQGQFNNTGTLNDVYNQMSAINNNTSIRVHKHDGPWTEGVPVPNVLDVGSSPGSTVLSWYTTSGGNTIAGTYNSTTNTFTPNVNAVGLTSLFVRTRINTGGVTRRHELIVDSGINSSSPLISPNDDIQEHSSIILSVGPNPAYDNIRIEIRNAKEKQFDYALYSVTGEVVANGIIYDGKQSVNLSSDLPAGLYFIRIMNANTGFSETRQLRVIH